MGDCQSCENAASLMPIAIGAKNRTKKWPHGNNSDRFCGAAAGGDLRSGQSGVRDPRPTLARSAPRSWPISRTHQRISKHETETSEPAVVVLARERRESADVDQAGCLTAREAGSGGPPP